MEIRQLSPRTYKLKKGQTIICNDGSAWITAGGKDIILESGESYRTESRVHHAVVCPVGTDEISLSINS
ncbi:MAG: hypothetical protein JEY99_15290 [Spirochaetales bacterium]|nr:hypothetical protein [Spirochaetales bacterium]